MKKYLYTNLEVLEEARVLLSTSGASTYSVAATLGRPQATVWWHRTHRRPETDQALFRQVRVILRQNDKGGGR